MSISCDWLLSCTYSRGPLPFSLRIYFCQLDTDSTTSTSQYPTVLRILPISLWCNAPSSEVSTMSRHVHFTAGLYDTLGTKDKLFSWTCPVTPQDDSLSVVIPRFVLPFIITSHPFPIITFTCGNTVHPSTSFLNYRLFKNLEENHYFLELECSLLRGLLVAVGRCNTQVRLSLAYVPGKPPRPPVPRIPLRKVLRLVTQKQDARIVDKVYC